MKKQIEERRLRNEDIIILENTAKCAKMDIEDLVKELPKSLEPEETKRIWESTQKTVEDEFTSMLMRVLVREGIEIKMDDQWRIVSATDGQKTLEYSLERSEKENTTIMGEVSKAFIKNSPERALFCTLYTKGRLMKSFFSKAPNFDDPTSYSLIQALAVDCVKEHGFFDNIFWCIDYVRSEHRVAKDKGKKLGGDLGERKPPAIQSLQKDQDKGKK